MTILNSSKLAAVLERFEAIEHEMSQAPSGEDYVRLSKEYAELEPVARAARTLKALEAERRGLQDMLASGESELAEMAEDELAALEIRAEKLDREIKVLLLPRDSADERNVILEIRAGTGGDEAALFAGDLFRMYQRYAALKNWRVEVITASEAEVGGYKEVIASIAGAGVFARLKFESGVHRVQPGHRGPGAHPHLGSHRGGAARGRRGRRRHRGEGSAHRRVPRLGARRSIGQHHRQRGAHHPHSERHRGEPAG